MKRIIKKVDLPNYLETRIKEQQNYANRQFLLHSERNAYMIGIYKVCLETALNEIKNLNKLNK